MATSTGLKMAMNRTSGSSRKASWIALRDRGTAALGYREGEIMTFDYCSPAELFTAKRKGGSRQRLGYRRFATAAEAIRFAVEEFPAMRSLGAWILVGDERFDSKEIHRLYESDDYPLGRRTG
jgi:hypothetical protein